MEFRRVLFRSRRTAGAGLAQQRPACRYPAPRPRSGPGRRDTEMKTEGNEDSDPHDRLHPMIGIVIVTHGRLAEALIHATEQVVGPPKNIRRSEERRAGKEGSRTCR